MVFTYNNVSSTLAKKHSENTHLPKKDIHYSKDCVKGQHGSEQRQEPLRRVGGRVEPLSFEVRVHLWELFLKGVGQNLIKS